MQLEINPQNKEKLEYLRKYDPLNDYISSCQVKQSKESQNVIDLGEFDLGKLQQQLQQTEIECDFENQIVIVDQITQQILNGFNILLYGYGSKIEFLEQVIQSMMKDMGSVYIFQLKGFKSQVNLKVFLTHIAETLRGKKKDTIPKKEDGIIEYLKQFMIRIVIVIHSIDGKHLLNKQQQNVIGNLSRLENINIIGSFDNYRYPQLCKINNVLYQCYDSYQPYINELQQQYEDQVGKKKQEEGLWYVLSSMTNRQQGISQLLANQVLNNKDGLNLQELYDVCLEEMIISSKEQLRENLKELMEHNIVEFKLDKYTMNYSQQTLKTLAQQFQQ